MLNIRLANSNEYQSVRGFYHSLISEMKSSNAKYLPGWDVLVYKKVSRPFDAYKTDKNGVDRYYAASSESNGSYL